MQLLAWAAALLTAGFWVTSAVAETVIIEPGRSDNTGGQHRDWWVIVAGGWSNTSAGPSATDTTAGIGGRFASSATVVPSFKLTPTLEIAGGEYRLDVTGPCGTNNSNTSPDIVVGVTTTKSTGTLVNTTTTAFQKGNYPSPCPLDKSTLWIPVGTFVLDPGETQPEIAFTYLSGTIAGTGGRFYATAFRLVYVGDPCTNVPPVAAKGPVAASAGEAIVNVGGVNSAATKVTVYADSVEIGSTTTILADPEVTPVTVSKLEKGKSITATQTMPVDGVPTEGCKPGMRSGPIVGGGRTPKIGISFDIKENTALTGPIGSNGGTGAADIFALPGTGFVDDAYAGGIAGAKEVVPGLCWQTVTVQRGVDSVYKWNNQTTEPNLDGDFGILESIWISAYDVDTGPYRIYLDNLTNGTTLIQGWEVSTTLGQAALFQQPSFSGTTNAALLLDGPAEDLNESIVVDEYADLGGRSDRISFQFISDSPSTDGTKGRNGVRLVTQNTNGGTPNPVVDLRLPISLRVLVLPVGQTPGTGPTLGAVADQQTTVGGSVTFTVEVVSSTGDVSYQWLMNGAPVGNGETLILENLEESANGAKVTVVVCDATGSTASNDATLTVRACAVPFADADFDNDVDQADFGLFQRCVSGDEPMDTGKCRCFSVPTPDGAGGYLEADNLVNMDDYAQFLKCVTGPEVPYVEADHPDCEAWKP